MSAKLKVLIGILLASVSCVNQAAEPPADAPSPTESRMENPYEKSSELDKFLRDNDHVLPSARRSFYTAFKEAQDFILAGKLDQAKKPLAKLHSIKDPTKYEEARIYLLDYWYEGRAGDKVKETEALVKLMPLGAGNVDADAFVEAGIRLLKRQYNSQDYGGAIDTLEYLRKEPTSQNELMAITFAVQKLDDIATGNQDIVQQIKTNDTGRWGTKLLRATFYLDKINGEVNNIDFDCESNKSILTYKIDSVMSVPVAWGRCSIKINATPNTTFNIIQLVNKPAA